MNKYQLIIHHFNIVWQTFLVISVKNIVLRAFQLHVVIATALKFFVDLSGPK